MNRAWFFISLLGAIIPQISPSATNYLENNIEAYDLWRTRPATLTDYLATEMKTLIDPEQRAKTTQPPIISDLSPHAPVFKPMGLIPDAPGHTQSLEHLDKNPVKQTLPSWTGKFEKVGIYSVNLSFSPDEEMKKLFQHLSAPGVLTEAGFKTMLQKIATLERKRWPNAPNHEKSEFLSLLKKMAEQKRNKPVHVMIDGDSLST